MLDLEEQEEREKGGAEITEETDRSRESKSREVRSRDSKRRLDQKSVESSTEYLHNGVYSLQEAQRITERLRGIQKRKKDKEARQALKTPTRTPEH